MIRTMIRFALLLATACFAAPVAMAGISVALPDGKSVSLSDSQLASLPRMVVSATAHGKTSRFEGSDLREVLRAAGATPLESLRGPQLRRVVVVAGADGYRVVFALSELDPTIGARQILLANRENGEKLPASDGPLRMVVPGDRRPARWVRQVVALTIVDLP